MTTGASLRGDEATTYDNPIIPGFYPDPSVCRVGNDTYVATSTFEYFPGVPIFHSRDLSSWRQVGHALTRDSQLALEGCLSSQGIFAPTLRHHEGTFYLVSSNMSGDGNFLITAKHPAGPWSDPIWLDEGMDPSLFFDDDGTVYYTRHGGGERGVILQARLDVSSGKLLDELRPIWPGTGGIWPEAPHLYKVNGVYYLMIAEGGTSYDHMVTVARSESPWGPFQSNPGNPILTHRGLEREPIQATGHADLFQASDGNWWMVFLGIRPTAGRHHHLGRETFLAPVSWKDGWPVVNSGQPVPLRVTTPSLPPPGSEGPERLASGVAPSLDDFRSSELPHHYCHVRNPVRSAYSLAERPGMLRLHASTTTMSMRGSPTFVGRRQQHFALQVRTELHFEPTAPGQEAGLVLRMNEAHHYDLLVTSGDGGRYVQLRTTVAGVDRIVARKEVGAGALQLVVDATRDDYRFSYAAPGAPLTTLGKAPTLPLSTELAGGFTGVVLGPYAYTPATPCWADFAFLELRPV